MSEQPDTCPGPCNLDAMREDGWKRCAHSILIPPVPDHPHPVCEHDWKQYRDGKPPKCTKCGECKQAYADIEADRDRYRAALEEIREVELPYEKSWVIAGDALGIDGEET